MNIEDAKKATRYAEAVQRLRDKYESFIGYGDGDITVILGKATSVVLQEKEPECRDLRIAVENYFKRNIEAGEQAIRDLGFEP